MNKEKEHADFLLNQLQKENNNYTDRELSLIKSVQNSDISDNNKISLGVLFINYFGEKNLVRRLQERLRLSYTGVGTEAYLDKIVCFNPKLGIVTLEAGESGLDENDDLSCYLSFKIDYNPDVEKYFKNAEFQINKIKQVLRIILGDAKKMRIV